jgi:hypothetical protein
MKKVNDFNKRFDFDFVLLLTAVRNSAQTIFYNNAYLYLGYLIQMGGAWYPIRVEFRPDGGVQIVSPKGILLNSPFECYLHFVCNDNYDLALDWKNNSRLFNVQKRAPLIDIDNMIDSSNKRLKQSNLLSCIVSQQSRSKRIATHLAKVCQLPIDSVLLLLLGIFSAMAGKRYRCVYEDGRKTAIGLYVAVEQPSGTSKTRLQSILLDPMLKMIREKMKVLSSMISEAEDELTDLLEISDKFDPSAKLLRRKIRALKKELESVENLLPITNATPESLEVTLNRTNGAFSAISSEKGLINSMLGFSYGRKGQNHDVLLNGREGGEIKSNRVGREGYSGPVYATVVCFAQEGTVLKIIEASEVTGLSERFVVKVDPDLIGSRDYVNAEKPDFTLLKEYETQCVFFGDVLDKGFDPDKLIDLHIQDQDWLMIHHTENEFEHKLIAGQIYSSPTMRRFVSKSRLQIMGLASNLYLLDSDPSELPTDNKGDNLIPSIYVMSAIYLMKNLIEDTHVFCVNNGLINNSDQLKVVYDLFSKHGALTMHEIKKKCEGVKPFRDLDAPRKTIEGIVNYFEHNHVLIRTDDDALIKNPEPYRSLI